MKKLIPKTCEALLIAALMICSFSAVVAQQLSDLSLSDDRQTLAYLSDSDSLFIANVSGSTPSVRIDSELSDNVNQRFLQFTKDGRFLIYEKAGKLYIYNLRSRVSKIIPNVQLGALNLSRDSAITQTGINRRGELFFSAGSDAEARFQLFKLNVQAGKLEQLTRLPDTVGNVSVSPDGKTVIFATHKYSDDNQPESRLYLLNAMSGRITFTSEVYKNTLFAQFNWSPSGRKILARTEGAARLMAVSATKLKELPLTVEPNLRLLAFQDENTLLFSKRLEKGANRIGSLNINNQKQRELLDETATYLAGSSGANNFTLLYVTESRIQPKTIWSSRVTNRSVAPKTKVRDLAGSNPLGKYAYEAYWYRNGGGGDSAAYIYQRLTQKPTRQRPLLIVAYGGYGNSYPDMGYFLYEKLFDYLDKDYVIVFPNTRGISSQRQTANYGKIQLADTAKIIDEIAPRYDINRQKIFVLGHSHGAAMVYYYLTHSDLFAGGIAVNGAADWIKQAPLKRMSGLPAGMGGLPTELPDKYTEASPLEQIDKLHAPLLIFAGQKDTQIPSAINAEAFQRKAKEKGKNVNLIIFPDEGHLLEKPIDKNIFWNEIDRFLNAYNKE